MKKRIVYVIARNLDAAENYLQSLVSERKIKDLIKMFFTNRRCRYEFSDSIYESTSPLFIRGTRVDELYIGSDVDNDTRQKIMSTISFAEEVVEFEIGDYL